MGCWNGMPFFSYNEVQMPCCAADIAVRLFPSAQRRWRDVMQDNHSDKGVNIEPSHKGSKTLYI